VGILDHRRTWHYEVIATPAQCIGAFTRAFENGGAFMRKAKWRVKADSDRATATYVGRAGIAAAYGVMSRISDQESETAVGSVVSLKIEGSSGGKTRASMALTMSGRSGLGVPLGMTSDARFIRPYMQAVAVEIRKLDPAARIETA